MAGQGFQTTELKLKFNQFKKNTPRRIGNIAKKFAKDSFRRQGWLDKTLQPWAKRKAGAPRNKGRAILVDTGHMRRSIFVKRADIDKVIVGTRGVKYAQFHNEGIGQTERRFIGDSDTLTKKMMKAVVDDMDKIFT